MAVRRLMLLSAPRPPVHLLSNFQLLVLAICTHLALTAAPSDPHEKSFTVSPDASLVTWSHTMCASCEKMPPSSTMVASTLCSASARLL